MSLVFASCRSRSASFAVLTRTNSKNAIGQRSGSSIGIRSCARRPAARLASSSSSSSTTAAAESASSASSSSASSAAASEVKAAREAQRRAYEHYRRKSEPTFPFNLFRGTRTSSTSSAPTATLHERNVKIASYALAAVIGALGATYASVPLYKVFCQATGFGGTTQRVTLSEWAERHQERENEGKSGRSGKISQALWSRLKEMSNVPAEMLPGGGPGAGHGRGGPRTWTDEEAAARLAELKPVKDGRLITVRFDSTVGDVMPWEFVPTQLDVKVVPGETALSFFTATNKSPDKAITGVATYNVHPPRAGLYFNKIQCFCFEEQRLLPGETVDMPVFFFIDPEFANDAQLARVNNVTLSYTFFQTDLDYDEDEEEEEEEDEEQEEDKDDEEENKGGATGSGEGRGGQAQAAAASGWTKRLAFWRS